MHAYQIGIPNEMSAFLVIFGQKMQKDERNAKSDYRSTKTRNKKCVQTTDTVMK